MKRAVLGVATIVSAAILAPGSSPATGPVRVAVLDTGILTSHSEFRTGQVVVWKDYVQSRSTPYDDYGHGTAVASRAAGRTLGAYPAADLVVAKVLDQQNRLPSWTSLSQAIRWATDQDAAVINVSIWGSLPSPTEHRQIAQAIAYATTRGSLVVWIAGNGGEVVVGNQGLPSPITATVLTGAASPQALVVGASDSDGDRAPFSQRDPELIAWGQDVPIAWGNGGIYTGWGTSFAAPWIAGAAARLIADGAPRDAGWLKWVLLHRAQDDPSVSYLDEGYGFFGADQLAAARRVASSIDPVPEPDQRDAFHIATAGARTGQSGSVPAGATPQ